MKRLDCRWNEKVHFPVALLCIMAAVIMTGCGQEKKEANVPKLLEPVGVDVDTATVTKMKLSNVNNVDGQIIPEIVDACFEKSGNISKMNVKIGDKVKKGQLLATISGETGSKKIKSLKKALDELKAQNKETNKMSEYDIKVIELEKGKLESDYKKETDSKVKKNIKQQIIVKEEDIKLAKLRLKQQKELQQLEINRKQKDIDKLKTGGDSSELRAPISGEVVSTAGGSGYMIQGGKPAVRIANMSKPRVMTEYVGAATLNKASSYYAVVDGKNYKVKAEEQEVDAMAIESGQGLPSNTYFDFVDENLKLPIGSYALIQLNNNLVQDSLVVPANAVSKDDNGRYVYKQEDGRKVRVNITVGTSTDAFVQVLTGLEEGDVVYVAG